eukprot:scaffold1023_cov313-Pinguiococcus_pyrenoidosus.AAC.26
MITLQSLQYWAPAGRHVLAWSFQDQCRLPRTSNGGSCRYLPNGTSGASWLDRDVAWSDKGHSSCGSKAQLSHKGGPRWRSCREVLSFLAPFSGPEAPLRPCAGPYLGRMPGSLNAVNARHS